MASLRSEQAFTISELLVVVSLTAVLSVICVPQLSAIQSQMYASQDIRNLATTLAQLRAEAVRTRRAVRVSFEEDGITWDIFDDNTDDGSWNLSARSSWQGGTPDDILFNGIGLVRSINGEEAIQVVNGDSALTLTINQNGHVGI